MSSCWLLQCWWQWVLCLTRPPLPNVSCLTPKSWNPQPPSPIGSWLLQSGGAPEPCSPNGSCLMGCTASQGAPSSSLLLSSLELIDTKVYRPSIRAFLGTASQFCEAVVLNSKLSNLIPKWQLPHGLNRLARCWWQWVLSLTRPPLPNRSCLTPKS